jgi:hypothetical protein
MRTIRGGASMTVGAVVSLCLACSASLAQPDPMEPGATPAKAPKAQPAAKAPAAGGDDQALAGPRVDKAPTGKTLIERNFDGSLVRIDERPEQAATALLTLSADEKAAVTKLFDDRAAGITKLLYEHFDTFLAIQAARQGGAMRPGGDPKEREALQPKMKELRTAAEEAGLLRPALVEQVAKLLSEDQATEYRRIVGEYMAALEAQFQRENGQMQGAFSRPGNPTPDVPRRGGPGADRAEINLLLREVARSLGAIVQERKEQLEALFKAVDATPEQQSKIEAIVRQSAGQNKLRPPSPEQRAENFMKIMDVLTPEQREKARERFRGSQS